MTEEKKENLNKLKKIIDGLDQFRSGKYPGTIEGDSSEAMKFVTQARALIAKIASESSEYMKQYKEIFKNSPEPNFFNIQSLKGILKALLEDYS